MSEVNGMAANGNKTVASEFKKICTVKNIASGANSSILVGLVGAGEGHSICTGREGLFCEVCAPDRPFDWPHTGDCNLILKMGMVAIAGHVFIPRQCGRFRETTRRIRQKFTGGVGTEISVWSSFLSWQVCREVCTILPVEWDHSHPYKQC